MIRRRDRDRDGEIAFFPSLSLCLSLTYGAIEPGVPTMDCAAGFRVLIENANPKSPTLTVRFSLSRILAVLRSRWMILLSWRYWTPSAISMQMFRRCLRVREEASSRRRWLREPLLKRHALNEK